VSRTFIERLHAAPILVSDGATGTNISAWARPRAFARKSGCWMLPQVLALHAAFVAAGSDLSSRIALGGRGCG